MVYDEASDRYGPIGWADAFALAGRTLRELDRRGAAVVHVNPLVGAAATRTIVPHEILDMAMFRATPYQHASSAPWAADAGGARLDRSSSQVEDSVVIGDDARVDEGRGGMSGVGLPELAAWAETRMPRLIDDACAAIVERIEVYRRDRLVPIEDLRTSVAQNLRAILRAIGHPQASLDLAAPQETGRRRAHQGVPLPEVLQAYRISFATLWDALVEHARRGGRTASGDALLTASSMIWQLSDEHAVALTESYRAATAEILLAQQRRRSALVEALLAGQPGPQTGPWEAAAMLGLPPDADQVVVAADTRDLAEESLTGIERRLATRGIVSGWRLTPALQLGIVSLHADQRDTVLTVLREAASTRTGVSPPYRSLADTPRALQLARAALAGLPAGRAEVRVFDPSPLAAFMACDPDEGRRLAKEVLGAVLEQAPEDRATLLDTLNAYLDRAGSAERAAEVLYCHPNTVRYRLRRLHELTGRSLSDPRQAAELASAAYALRLTSPSDEPPRARPHTPRP